MNLKHYIDHQTAKAIKKFPHRAKDIVQSFDPKQILCKKWLIDELKNVADQVKRPRKIYIAGSWYGNVLVPLLQEVFPGIEINLHDIDEEVVKISQSIYFENYSNIIPSVKDCSNFFYDKKRTLVINTSCEHMPPLQIKPDVYVILQSNNYHEIEEHVNCVDSPEELAEQYNVTEIFYSGELQFEKYTRYMVIGKT